MNHGILQFHFVDSFFFFFFFFVEWINKQVFWKDFKFRETECHKNHLVLVFFKRNQIFIPTNLDHHEPKSDSDWTAAV